MSTTTIYTPAQLRYAATSRCPCGAGLAYPADTFDIHGAWDCSAILTGTAIPSGHPGAVQHTGRLPFAFYEIRSEDQSPRETNTTRPSEPEGQRDMHASMMAWNKLTHATERIARRAVERAKEDAEDAKRLAAAQEEYESGELHRALAQWPDGLVIVVDDKRIAMPTPALTGRDIKIAARIDPSRALWSEATNRAIGEDERVELVAGMRFETAPAGTY